MSRSRLETFWWETMKPRLPLAFVFLSGIMFSIQGLIIKQLEEKFDYTGCFTMVTVRGVVQMVFSLIITHRHGGVRFATLFGENFHQNWLLAVRGLFGVMGLVFAFLAMERLPLGDAMSIIMTSPMITGVLAVLFLGERYGWLEGLTALTSLGGVTMIARPHFLFGSGETNGEPIGFVFAGMGAFGAANAFICVRKLGTMKVDYGTVMFAQSFGQLVIGLPFIFVFKEGLPEQHQGMTYTLVLLMSLVAVCGQTLMTYGLQRCPSAPGTMMRMSDIVLAFIWQQTLTSEPVSVWSLLGSVLIISGIIVVAVFRAKDETSLSPAQKYELDGEYDGAALLEEVADGDGAELTMSVVERNGDKLVYVQIGSEPSHASSDDMK